MNSNAVNECPADYVGQTARYLSSRVSEHRKDYRLDKSTSVIANRSLEFSHTFNFDESKIKANDPKLCKMLVLEMFNINEPDNTINRRTDILNLSKIYTCLNHFNIINSDRNQNAAPDASVAD